MVNKEIKMILVTSVEKACSMMTVLKDSTSKLMKVRSGNWHGLVQSVEITLLPEATTKMLKFGKKMIVGYPMFTP